jgi:hypothetical protein
LKIDQYLDFALETAQKSLDFLEKTYLPNDKIKFSKIGGLFFQRLYISEYPVFGT